MSETIPSVSVIIPAKDAAETLPRALASVTAQTYPKIVEVIVAAADRDSAAAAEGATVIDNPAGITPSGLNAAIGVASGEVIVRCDAHSVLPPEYVARAVATLVRTDADNVGGMQIPVGSTFWERAIAAAMASPLGAGDARYRIGGDEGPVETVYLGVFWRKRLEAIGGFNESFVRTQDYELNHRIISAGGVVWFDPGLRVEYRPRGSLTALARQYYRYGQAKRRFRRLNRARLRARQIAPTAVVIGLTASGLLTLVDTRWLAVPLLYLAGILLGTVFLTRWHRGAKLGSPAAYVVMHLSWGTGFLLGALGAPQRTAQTSER